MDEQTDKDFNLLSEENSDFDILLSPASGKSDDDDEVFLGPVRHVEKCVSVGIDLSCKEEKCSKATETGNWSPLNTDQFFEVSKEANLLAHHLENQMEGKCKKMGNQMTHNKIVEQFIEESKLKLTLLKGMSSPSCARRETFVVQDSPLRLLPPAIQKRLQVNSLEAQPSFQLKPMKTAILETNSLMQPQQNCGNSSFVNNDVPCTENNTLKENPSVEQSKCAPTKYITSEKVSEPNVSGFKASGSMTKHSTGSAARTLGHTSSCLRSRLHNSSSGGRAVSLTMRPNASKLQALKNSSRIASPKIKSSSSTCTIDAPRAALKPANTYKITASGMMSQKGTGLQSLPDKSLQRISLIDMNVDKVKSNQIVKALGRDRCPKTKASVVNSQVVKRSSAPSPGTTTGQKITQPKKLLSCSAVESGIEARTPNRPLTREMLQTPTITNKLASVTSATKRLPALPTPLNRRRSGIPTFTPRTQPRPASSLKITTRNRSMSANETILVREQTLRKPEGLCSSESSEEDLSPSLIPCVLDFSPDKPQKALKHPTEPQSKENFTVEGTKNKQIQDRPLIDLSNTPEINRVAPMKAPETLIDFNSPLIMLSPANKENVNLDSPLLKF
ncbi:G2 and S phase-expressed protein 1 isoform X1 [Stegostoma tigrinum]|uniref:G2 and S phase-expressed protein 1 isoform X1 n=1 Tax=Stegostoma tigrinum TaxID=3053191 RepID=UPI00202ADF0D|nr:G2 and S phase-expressed protein 1 isoform X1 [Stegostoma tigrinum]XP_048410536.1 G2 and S phase-expressed protein 1 isoform X1 [Stegostoma tigrinum]XP_059510611.1 G2 and S phase-expressed protein 1 isoform X1 [Stegostoma tigrinum]